MYLNPKNRSVSFQKRLKMFYFHQFKVFTRCRFQNVPIRFPFSKSAVFKICRQKICRFHVNRRPIRRIFHCFQNVPASCERSLNFSMCMCTSCCLSVHQSINRDTYEYVISLASSLFIGIPTSIFKILFHLNAKHSFQHSSFNILARKGLAKS